MNKEEFQNNLIVGATSGVIAGIILLFGQFIAELCEQKYNILLIASISVFGVIILAVSIDITNSKKSK